MAIFNIFRSGYQRGYQDGQNHSRHLAGWELLVTAPLSWLPGVDSRSYIQGYHHGYTDGFAAKKFIRTMAVSGEV